MKECGRQDVQDFDYLDHGSDSLVINHIYSDLSLYSEKSTKFKEITYWEMIRKNW